MRPVHNFLELPGQDDMASFALKSLVQGHIQDSLVWSQLVAGNIAEDDYEDVQALAAVVLARADKQDAALEAWDRIAKKAPQNLNWLFTALNAAWELEEKGVAVRPYVDDWLRLLERVYSSIPTVQNLHRLRQKGWQGKGSIGIQKGRLLGWFFLKTGENIQVRSDLPAGSRFKLALMPLARIDNEILYSVNEVLPLAYGQFSLEFQAGEGVVIPGSPVVCSPPQVRRKTDRKNEEVPVTVLMPVYDDERATIQGIASVLASLRKNSARVKFLVVWDHGPNERLLARLRDIAAKGLITLVENNKNLGFLGTVNNALSQYIAGDVILLNSDTIVTGNWIDRMLYAGSCPDAATVTALSNEAELMSFPSVFERGKIRSLRDAKIMDKAASVLLPEIACQEIPVGVGFCMLITREAMDRIGILDGTFIFRGYGEESEFCLRASKNGLKNYGAFNVFVGHLGEKSFGLTKKALAAQNNKAIKELYPDYPERYSNFIHDPVIKNINQEISRHALLERTKPVSLAIWPWGAREFPFLQGIDNDAGPEKLNLFLRAGVSARALLRPALELSLAGMDFTDMQDLKELLWRLPVSNVEIHDSTDGLLKMAQSLTDLPIAEAQAQPLPELSEDVSCSVFYCALPINVAAWKSLRAVAQKRPDASFYVTGLDLVWPNLPRPINVYSLPVKMEPRLFSPEAFLLPYGQGDADAWREWLDSRDLCHIDCYSLERA